MGPEDEEYKGHRIELRVPNARQGTELELLIDGEPVRYGQLPDGQYFLHEYAYDWHESLAEVARRFIDYRHRTDEVRAERETGEAD